MRAGNYRHKIDIQATTTSADGYGGVTDSWANFSQPWARIVETKGSEKMQAGQEGQDRMVKFECREFISGVDNSMRVVFDSINYEIESVYDPDGRKRNMILECRVRRL